MEWDAKRLLTLKEIGKFRTPSCSWNDDGLKPKKLQTVAVSKGGIKIPSGSTAVKFSTGRFGLIPASLKGVEIRAEAGTTFLCVEAEPN
jgi:hypothetical protein